MKKFVLLLASVVWILTIPLLIISTTSNAYTGCVGLYNYGFDKYQISQVTGINRAQLNEVAQKMADYLTGKISSPQLIVDTKDGRRQLYNEKELTHLVDVRGIVSFFQLIQIISAALFILLGIAVYFGMGIRRILKGLQIGSIITAAFTTILIIWALIDFDSLFYLFHIVSFSNNLWLLDPAVDYLIMLVPEGFFNDAALFMILTTLGASIVIWAAAFILNKRLFVNAGKA